MHIPIVEDDPVVADVLDMTLEEAGYFQSTAQNIETALAELKHNAIDAVLLDINPPDGDGTRLARLIRKNHMPSLFWSYQAMPPRKTRLRRWAPWQTGN